MSGVMMGDIESIFTNEDVRVATPETTGQRIHWLRRYTLKMKQKDFAAALGTSQGFMSEIESDKKEAGNTLLAKIADTLHTTTDYLLLRTDDPTSPDDKAPTFFSPEAERAARIVDNLYPDERGRAIAALEEIRQEHDADVARQKLFDYLFGLIRDLGGPEYVTQIEREIGVRAPFVVRLLPRISTDEFTGDLSKLR